jgi:glucose-6-phosphate 1-dehydrogenase
MSATEAPQATRTKTDAGPRPADVLVIFGITGDLAKVMTFHSLYRLEQRGLLDCPIVGVAVDDWTIDQLVQRARDSIEGTGETIDPKVFDRFAARLSYVSGDFTDGAVYERVGDAILRHVVDRPLTLVHCPDGLNAPCNYMRHRKVWGPDVLRRVKIKE